jgi:hypothetical protein
VTDGEAQYLTTVTSLAVGEVSEDADVENVDAENAISLNVDEDGNTILTIPGLQVGDMKVTVVLRAIDGLEVYQVQEITVEPEEVFEPESDDSGEVTEAETEAADAEAEVTEEVADANAEATESEEESEAESTEEGEEVEPTV